MAADEARHAELAWSVIEFCIAAGGPSVCAALLRTAREIQAAQLSVPRGPGRDMDLSAHGFLSDAEVTDAFTRARARLLKHVAALVDSAPGRGLPPAERIAC